MSADISTLWVGGAGGTAFADPIISIDPSYADAGQFTLVESLNVSNSAAGAVPEPSTWLLMLLGFGALGFAGHRRTKAA